MINTLNIMNGHWWMMGRYTVYVWSAYGFVGFIFLLHWLGVRWQHRRINQMLREWFQR